MGAMMGAFDQMLGGPPLEPPTQQQSGALGNRATPPRRAIDKLMMKQQQEKQAMSFPTGIPQNQQPPQMQAANAAPNATSFLSAVLGR
jgi:hypothetical protein